MIKHAVETEGGDHGAQRRFYLGGLRPSILLLDLITPVVTGHSYSSNHLERVSTALIISRIIQGTFFQVIPQDVPQPLQRRLQLGEAVVTHTSPGWWTMNRGNAGPLFNWSRLPAISSSSQAAG